MIDPNIGDQLELFPEYLEEVEQEIAREKERKAQEARERAKQRARERREYIKRIQEQRETEAQNMAKVIPFRRKNKVIPQFERGDAS